MQNFKQQGDVVAVTAPYALASGAGCLVGHIFGVAMAAAAISTTVQIKRSGVFTLAKTTSEAWTVGAILYWDDTNKKLTTTATSNTRVGVAMAAAGSSDTTGDCLLDGHAA